MLLEKEMIAREWWHRMPPSLHSTACIIIPKLAAHQGRNRTFLHIRETFFWPTLNKDVGAMGSGLA